MKPTNSEIRCAMHGAHDPEVDVTYLQNLKVYVERMPDSYIRGHWLWNARTTITREVLQRELSSLGDVQNVVSIVRS